MTSMDMPARLQRIAALGILLITICMIYTMLIAPLARAVQDTFHAGQARLAALSHDKGLIEQDKVTREKLHAVETSLRWGRLYPTQRPDKAALQLEADIRALIKSPNIPISLSVAPPAIKGVWTVLSVKMRLAMTLGDLADLLDKLQRHGKYLQLEELVVQSPEAQSRDVNPVLSIQAQVSALMLTKEHM